MIYVKMKFTAAALLVFIMAGGAAARPEGDPNYRYFTAVKTCLNNLIQYGRDDYGAVKTPVLVSILDVNTHRCPREPLKLDEDWRVIRRERRNPAGSNLFTDQPLIQTLFVMSRLTNDKTYSDAATAYIQYCLTNLVDKKGLFWWGGHRHYDVYDDTMTGHLLNWHEIHGGTEIQWETLWQINPDAVRKEIEAIWQWHVIDKKTGETNRHDDGLRGCDFAFTSGSYIEAFAFLYSKTKEQVWLDRAKLLANYFWNLRNKDTNLIAERPNAGNGRFDGAAFATDITGPYCQSLLRAYLLTQDPVFKEQAVAYLAAYNQYGYDREAGKFRGALKLDGTPIPGPRLPASPEPEQFGNAEQYAQYEPRGYLDLWEPFILGSQFPLETAQSYAFAYRLTKDPDMLLAAGRFADWIEKTPTDAPETEVSWYAEYKQTCGKMGTYAEKYGRAILFFNDMYVLTGQKKYLQVAQKFADEAMSKLYVNGFFKGHPAKPYYESIDGPGILMYALLELDRIIKSPQDGVKTT